MYGMSGLSGHDWTLGEPRTEASCRRVYQAILYTSCNMHLIVALAEDLAVLQAWNPPQRA